MRKAGNLIDRQVGARIRSLRDASGISIYEIAVLLGVSVDKFTRLETGLERFPAPQLRMLAEKFGVSVTKFFDRIELSEADGETKSNVVPLFSALH